MRAHLYRLLYRIHLLLAIVTLASFAAPSFSPNTFWPAVFLGLSIPVLLLAHFVFALWWLSVRRYYFLVSIGCILAGWSHVQRLAGWHRQAEALPGETSISVLTYNIHGLRDAADNSNVNVNIVAQLAAQRDCDLLCLQEFPQTANRLNELTDFLQKHTRLKYHYSDRNGNFAFFSAYPVIDSETQYFPNRSNGYQRVDVQAGKSTVRVFNVHLQSNAVTQIADRVASEGDLKEKQTWLDIRGMMGRFKRAARQRAFQAEEIAGRIAGSKHPVLVCGDFNDTPHSYTYHVIASSLQDAFRAKGRGLGITYAGRIPVLRIDYIMAGQEFKVLAHEIEKKGFSDHRAVWGRLAW